jgi:uncharacterized protein
VSVRVGEVFARHLGPDRVSASGIRQFVEAYQLSDPLFHDRDAARAAGHAGLLSPAAMMLTWVLPPYWSPGEPPMAPGVMPGFAWTKVDLPGSEMMATSIDLSFDRPVVEGMRLSATYAVTSVVPKTTRVGTGSFVGFRVEVCDEDAELVGTMDLTSFRYDPTPHGDQVPRVARASEPPAPGDFPDVEVDLTLQRLVMMCAANRDYAPTHIDDAAALASGAPAAYADMISIFALAEKAVLDRLGPGIRVAALREVRLRSFTVHGRPLRIRTSRVPGAVGGAPEVDVAFYQDGELPTATARVVLARTGTTLDNL